MEKEVFQVESYSLSVIPNNGFHYYIKIEGEDHVAQFYFNLNTVTLPLPKKVRDKEYLVRYHDSQYADIVDLLRNEKPLYFTFHVVGNNSYTHLSTSKEPVGEGE